MQDKPAIIRACIHVQTGRLPTLLDSPMKKNFPLQAEGKHPDRVLEAVKHEIEAVDAAAKSGAMSVYVEILSKHGVRVLKAQDHSGGENHFDDLQQD